MYDKIQNCEKVKRDYYISTYNNFVISLNCYCSVVSLFNQLSTNILLRSRELLHNRQHTELIQTTNNSSTIKYCFRYFRLR